MKKKYCRLLFTLLLILATLGPTSALAAPNGPDLSQTQAESNTVRAERHNGNISTSMVCAISAYGQSPTVVG